VHELSALQHVQDITKAKWFFECTYEPQIQLFGQLLRSFETLSVTAHQNNRTFRFLVEKFFQDLKTIHIGHHHINENNITISDLIDLAGPCVSGNHHFIAQPIDQLLHKISESGLIVDDDHSSRLFQWRGFRAGHEDMPISSSIILVELSTLLFVPKMNACLSAVNVRRCAVGPNRFQFSGG
jgi:hypothetical protein